MKAYLLLPFFLLFISFLSCGKDTPVTPPDKPEPEEPSVTNTGFTFNPSEINADKELVVIFKAATNSALYNYAGDVYLYSGIIDEGEWSHTPSDWVDNNIKYKMTKVEPNVWSIKLSPTVREWYKASETPIHQLGLLVRNTEGTKKGIAEDFFVNVRDEKFKVFEPAAVKYSNMPPNLEEGINIIDNQTVVLVLYDKDRNEKRKDYAHVVGDFNNWKLSNDENSQMYRDDAKGCWWIKLSGLNPVKEYAFQYYVGNHNEKPIRIADAYTDKILDPANDKYIPISTYPDNKDYPAGAKGIVSTFRTKKDVYNWKVANFNPPSIDNLVIYELLIRDFSSTGDIKGAMQKLDYLTSMGINAIELLPVQEFDGNDSWGYNPCFYFALDKAYGTPKMYKEFIDACHERGIAVIFDVVYNHATGAHPFAKMWWNSSNNKTAENNPYFNVEAPHPFSVFHDFNHESPLVKKFVKRNLKFLLEEYNIDGFRFDLSKGFTQKQSNESSSSAYDASRIAIIKEYNDVIKNIKPKAMVILEHFADDREEKELSEAGMMMWRNMNHQYCQSAMGWKEKSSFIGTYYATSSRPSNSLIAYMESHDEERMAYKQLAYGNGYLKTNLNARMTQLATNAAFFFTVPGPKMVWQFGEMGYDISIEENGRTGRKPLRWNYLDISERNNLQKIYSQLINLRMQHREMFNSTSNLEWKVGEGNWDNGRFLTLSSFGNGKQLVAVGNFTNNTIVTTMEFPKTGIWYNFLTKESKEIDTKNLEVTVPANSFIMYTSFLNK